MTPPYTGVRRQRRYPPKLHFIPSSPCRGYYMHKFSNQKELDYVRMQEIDIIPRVLRPAVIQVACLRQFSSLHNHPTKPASMGMLLDHKNNETESRELESQYIVDKILRHPAGLAARVIKQIHKQIKDFKNTYALVMWFERAERVPAAAVAERAEGGKEGDGDAGA
ncbi:hypothetical protein BDP81DRAFT_24854 [Colletotrichum phormii]|uniref:Uncharacterized protein n=1 Tax=Colletotrichum phormii TaxID=359342 RepID=A0AAJ0EF21_9PEZI|nr:uncharacterized protein BDP81DRAFT_24854 [Colletotrichum phormii]KAK1636579.1 hypothetical protein BDP81DRAFT_24854 [Colletotrichum phormii]